MKSLRLLLLPLIALCTLNQAQCEDLPDHLASLIHGQTHVGLKRIEKSNDYIVTIVSDAEATLEQDVANLDVPELFAKYPRIEERGNARLTAFKKQLATKELPNGTRYGRAKLRVSSTAGTLHKVVHVGANYVLLETSDGDQQRRFAVNSRFIREIRWYSGPGFGTSVRHLRENETEQ